MISAIYNFMKRNIVFPLLLPLALGAGYAREPTNPAPYQNAAYSTERSHGTTIRKVAIARPYSLELVVNQDGRKGLDRLTRMTSRIEQSEGKNVLAAINGGYYDPPSQAAIGTLIYRRRHVINEKWNRAQIGIEGDNQPAFGYFLRAENTPFDYLLTGGPHLVRGGENVAESAIEAERFSRQLNRPNPRTAIGSKPDGTVVMMVADGRRSGERGLTWPELADLLLKEGCDQGISMDGGGSSTLVLSGEFYGLEKTENLVANNPSDGRERAVANGIVVIQR